MEKIVLTLSKDADLSTILNQLREIGFRNAHSDEGDEGIHYVHGEIASERIEEAKALLNVLDVQDDSAYLHLPADVNLPLQRRWFTSGVVHSARGEYP